ncbi:hypothetical protein HYPSUDRAFT_319151 [Hypholoma sublateritium FD-334 SS-4]|uniref:Uncharacterized protein n=1 Tax=Hypholoma sublateritium (strain FD-334 SS-4) TaxID=945553 RepID=A0A0D2PCU2_HYPSF|nr:hypothetical protein HYPSUDRAFT_319151 [Hypholoma sublateritium FD-334 SS-4]
MRFCVESGVYTCRNKGNLEVAAAFIEGAKDQINVCAYIYIYARALPMPHLLLSLVRLVSQKLARYLLLLVSPRAFPGCSILLFSLSHAIFALVFLPSNLGGKFFTVEPRDIASHPVEEGTKTCVSGIGVGTVGPFDLVHEFIHVRWGGHLPPVCVEGWRCGPQECLLSTNEDNDEIFIAKPLYQNSNCRVQFFFAEPGHFTRRSSAQALNSQPNIHVIPNYKISNIQPARGRKYLKVLRLDYADLIVRYHYGDNKG